ncbi:NFX1-type zinc finger-containing protein 1 isoform X2 [Bombina bombina]|uniref:NFX1-type zinc finger-containing protein 1 isoform X2 n=1 Tax=Bombina bombina TaxID=8345 RepID=UPI00235ADF8D|nr:NFX1-type zinc finger-containing protein 1 isoform X2 [Bombina bombina]
MHHSRGSHTQQRNRGNSEDDPLNGDFLGLSGFRLPRDPNSSGQMHRPVRPHSEHSPRTGISRGRNQSSLTLDQHLVRKEKDKSDLMDSKRSDDVRGRRINNTHSQARSQHPPNQSSSSRGMLSQRHKSPRRYGSQNMIGVLQNETKEKDKSDLMDLRRSDDVRGRRINDTHSQARSQHPRDQPSSSRGMLSQRHKSPRRYGSQNLTGVFQNEPKGNDHLSVFQRRGDTSGMRAHSVQSLLDFCMDSSKAEAGNRTGFKQSTALHKAKTSHREKKIDYVTINNFSELEPSEIVLKLAAPGSGLKEFLNESNVEFQLLKGFLKILNISITCITNRQSLIYILSKIQGSIFIKQVLPLHILDVMSNGSQQDKGFSFIDNIIVLLKELVSNFPSSSFAEVMIVETLLKKGMDDMLQSGKNFPEEIQKKLTELQSFLQYLQQKKQEGTLKSDNYVYMVGSRGDIQDNDFRSMSIYPTDKDIYLDQNPLMRPNIVNGSYPDAKSYLDTHFRLLREDFIRPLRGGISQLISIKQKDLAKAKFDDIRLYFDTKISSPLCTKAGIVHQVEFSIANLKQVLWESSRRLLYGSLVCLSNDNFKNMFYATVADRNVKDLKMGIITLMFTEESRQKLAQYSIEDRFLMVETTAYFEAYRHVLEGLKEMVDSEIPFQNYIVNCDTEMYAPSYVSENRTDYRLPNAIKGSHSNTDETVNFLKYYLHNKLRETTRNESKFDVLDFTTWPTKEELDLDRSQFKAYQVALTSELSIIQGPPGTGKTYVGLKIVHTLLANSKLWKENKNPILIVCYTNHALDQFLEGIYKYNKCEIVRVGSRSNSELMQRFALSIIRKEKGLGSLPGYLRAMHAELKDERIILERELSKKAGYLKNTMKGILHLNLLAKHMAPHHLESLKSKQISEKILEEWLGISAVYQNTPQTRQDFAFWGNENTTEENDDFHEDSDEKVIDEYDLIEVEDEVELSQLERMIDELSIQDEIQRARERAARAKREILSFVPEQLDNDEENNMIYEDTFQVPKDVKRKWKKKIQHQLEKLTYMDELDCNRLLDLWILPLAERWQIYRFWRSRYLQSIRQEIFSLENQYQIVMNRKAELRDQEDLLILQEADIIGMTTTGAAKFRRILQNIQPKIVVVEEAAEVLEAHIITALSPGCKQLVLIGDHQQLRPSTAVYELARNFNLEVSMFERLICMNVPYVRLDFQHRMRPEIARLITPHIYDRLENHESVLNFPNIKGVCANLYFVDHDHLEEHIKEGKSHRNVHEAAFVKSLCLYFIHQGFSPSEITILTTYSGQLRCLQEIMPKSTFNGVRVCVVDKYQGEENEIIILSLVRSNLEGNVGFLKIPNRVCVALSRAKKGLFCIGNMQLLSKVPLWSKINEMLKANGQIGKELKLQCQNHPNNVCYVSKSEDFENVPEGGCKIPCEFRLLCGHACTLHCHPYDPKHEEFKCMKPCAKKCENGHKCRKVCSMFCGGCEELVQKQIPNCGHMQDVPCHMPPSRFHCTVPCTKSIECGHQCVRTCWQECTRNCPQKITVNLECGHTITTLCYIKSEAETEGTKLACTHKCEELLSCGHQCPGTCDICLKRASHMDCTKQCGIVLFCGHSCEQKCSTDCFCLRTCERKCFHGKCSSKCSEPCSSCNKSCGWKCKHEKCTKLCYEPCDRDACDEPCWKKLKCGHPCIGLCGEPCPKKCRKCNADEVSEIVFGKEADPLARFVQLMDCSHFFEVTEFTKWMNQEEPDQMIKFKTCPTCSTPVRQSLRFGTIIKNTFADLETIKERIIYKWMNYLEVILSENEEILRHFPAVTQLMQEAEGSPITLRTLMLAGEKIQFCLKLGAIKEKLQEALEPTPFIDKQINFLYNKVKNAKSKHDLLEQHYHLLSILAVDVEILILEKNVTMFSLEKIKNLVKQSRAIQNNNAAFDALRAELRNMPIEMKLISLVDNNKCILNNEILRQDYWYKCSAGHIYCWLKDKDHMPACPQCSCDDVQNDEDDDEN